MFALPSKLATMIQSNNNKIIEAQSEEEGQLLQILDAQSPTSPKEMISDEEEAEHSPRQQQLHSMEDSPAASPTKRDEESVEEKAEEEEKVSEAASGAELRGSGDPTRFPWRLHRMLTEIEEKKLDLEGIVSWQPHGRCKCPREVPANGDMNPVQPNKPSVFLLVLRIGFCIRDRRAFVETVMPK